MPSLIPKKTGSIRRLVVNAFFSLLAIKVSFIATSSWSQSAYDKVICLTATTSAVDTTTAKIFLNWTTAADVTGNVTIYRRVKGASTWNVIATPAASLGAYTDTVTLGAAYEYSLIGSSSSAGTVYGELVSGHNIPLVENRGKVILLVDSSMATLLSPELKQLEQNLSSDGWIVFRHDVSRQSVLATSAASSDYSPRLAELRAVRTLIQNDYNNNGGGNDWALFILGHIPVPYSGRTAPDGHGDHYGAWSTDLYYADINGTWTDTTANTTYNVTQPSDPRNVNVPGDGKFDQATAPTDIELQAGRVDLWSMDFVPLYVSEGDKLRQYLVRDNRFRRNLAPYNTVARRGLVDDNFGYLGGEAFASSGWRTGISWFGAGSGKMDSLDWFSTLGTTPMLFAYGCGGGSSTSSDGVGYSVYDFGVKPSKAVFTLLFGSWFGDFDATNNFLRAPLAGINDSLGLTCAWSGRGYFHLGHMALGDTIGYSTRYTQNATLGTGDWPNTYTRAVQANLMGDPTLRLHSVAPPARVTAASSGSTVTLNWLASPDSGLSGYHVYRGASPKGPFTRISGTTATGANPTGSCLSTNTLTYTDTDSALVAGTSYTYLVKTVKMESSASGLYANQSLGEPVTLTHGGTYLPAPTRFTVARASSNSCLLTWDDNATSETSYRVERRDTTTSTWAQITSLPANATSYTDTGLTAGRVYHYRVRASNGTIYSDYSIETSDYNLPGFLRDSAYSYTTTKDVGVFNISPLRYNGSGGSVTAAYSTTAVLGSAGTDIVLTNSAVTWNNNESGTKSAPITILAPAGTQPTKIFKVNYSSSTNGLILTNPTTYVFVRDSAAINLPTPWLTTTLGSIISTDSGYAEIANGSYGLAARSTASAFNTTNNASDSVRYLYQTTTGDFQFTARVSYLSNTGTNVRAGLMVRSSLTGNAAMNALMLSPSLACDRYTRATTGATAALASPSVYAPKIPHWLRITRSGSTYISEQSANGATWTAAAANISIPAITSTAYVGLAMSTDPTAGDAGALGYAQLDNVTLYTVPTAITTITSGNGTASGQITLTWSASAAATSYLIERSTTSGSGFSQISSVSAPAITYTDTGRLPNITYYYRVKAVNPAFATTAYSPETSTKPYIPATISGWNYTYFGTETATGNAAPTADPDGDNIPNLLEYAFGLNPITVNDRSSQPITATQLVNGTNTLTITFIRNKNATDLTYTVEVTNDPTTGWTSINPLLTSNQVNLLDNTPSTGLQTITVKDIQAASAASQRFIRLRVTAP